MILRSSSFNAVWNTQTPRSWWTSKLPLDKDSALSSLASAALGEAYAADEKVELAITTLKDAITQMEELRDQVVGRQEGRHLFFENKVGPYHTLVKLLTRQDKSFEALLYA